MQNRVYGSRALIGIATPQGNPTVEPELATLWPQGVSMLVTRSTAQGDSRERLLAYFNEMDQALDSFGGIQLDAFGFACTASSYLLPEGRETAFCDVLSDRFGCPVITAGAAIRSVLRAEGLQSIAIASPYPAWIHELAVRYWQEQGFNVIAEASAHPDMEDTTAIYGLDPREAESIFAAAFQDTRLDGILVTGTGMPSLALTDSLSRKLGVPVISSNQCLARVCLESAGVQ